MCNCMILLIFRLYLLPEFLVSPAIAQQYWLSGIKPHKMSLNKSWNEVAMGFLRQLCHINNDEDFICNAEFSSSGSVTLFSFVDNVKVQY